MEELVAKIQDSYYKEIANIQIVGRAEICITIANGSNAEHFSQELQNHLVENIGDLDLLKVNIVDTQGAVVDSFATNQ